MSQGVGSHTESLTYQYKVSNYTVYKKRIHFTLGGNSIKS